MDLQNVLKEMLNGTNAEVYYRQGRLLVVPPKRCTVVEWNRIDEIVYTFSQRYICSVVLLPR